jgi:acetyl-CoA carboxylase biotin carboxylase subunit
MGNKETARALAVENGVPICPGINQNELEEEGLEEKCKTIGFPILVKASAGGGGIGMQIAKDYSQLKEVIEKTKNLAGKAFGNSDIFLEKYIANARHIEIQIFGYGEKKAIHLYERDCSLQRRFQKIIEESPAPNIERETINQMSECAVNFVSNQKYEGAGTVEFVYDVDNKKFYFLEMNTRVQVEHPVTEMVTGIDIIKEQIWIAFSGETALKQSDINPRGHAIECRINAEDASKNFQPSPGIIGMCHQPSGFRTRVDGAIFQGYKVTPYYDSMVCKLICHGRNRTVVIPSITNSSRDLFIL